MLEKCESEYPNQKRGKQFVARQGNLPKIYTPGQAQGPAPLLAGFPHGTTQEGVPGRRPGPKQTNPGRAQKGDAKTRGL